MRSWRFSHALSRGGRAIIRGFAVAVGLAICVFAVEFVRASFRAPRDRSSGFTFPPRENNQAPDFLLFDTQGITRTLEDIRGQVVILGFLCGCRPCRQWVREVRALQSRYPELAVLGVTGMDAVAARGFAQREGVRFPLLLDPGYLVSQAWESTSCPRSWIIDRGGIVAYESRVAQPVATTLAELRHRVRVDNRTSR